MQKNPSSTQGVAGLVWSIVFSASVKSAGREYKDARLQHCYLHATQ
ncbi:MAG: hypothetical protein KA803_17310 [Rhodoferax sp.]|nr:hypothetical protein [Rhodoferax sp.]